VSVLLFPTSAELMPLPRRTPAELAPPRPNAAALLGEYLSKVYPARGHGATDCGEMLWGQTDAEHMIAWLRSRGVRVTL
jgi:hypothetical protein